MHTAVKGYCLGQRSGKTFENRFDDVMRILAVKHADMQREACLHCQSAEKFLRHLGIVNAKQQTELLEILRFDVFCEIPQWRPEWLKWQTEAIYEVVSAFWRDEEKVRRYIPAYKFSSWRQIHKLYPIELFKADWETGNAEEIFVMLDNSGEQQKLIKLPIEVK